jgi:hypothetical protein
MRGARTRPDERLARRHEPDAVRDEVFADSYREALRLYSPSNIRECCRLLVKRSAKGQQTGWLSAGKLGSEAAQPQGLGDAPPPPLRRPARRAINP